MPRCLIVERHEWETGAHAHQLQIPLAVATQFFGSGIADRNLQVRLFVPPSIGTPIATERLTISRTYHPSRTRRTNRLPILGTVGSAFVFIEETTTPGIYDMWWQGDKTIVAARYDGWIQARSSQYGRGRIAVIVDAPVPRPIARL